jgi:hypothetical protein
MIEYVEVLRAQLQSQLLGQVKAPPQRQINLAGSIRALNGVSQASSHMLFGAVVKAAGLSLLEAEHERQLSRAVLAHGVQCALATIAVIS